MVDLKERFQALDQVPAPDLGRMIELRARHLASVPGALGSDPDAIGGRRFRVPRTQLLAAAAIVILGVGLAVIIHQARSTAPVRHAPTPTPPQGQVIPYKGIWPETSLEDAQYAQQRADSGDAAYNWQVDSNQDTHVPRRFLKEQLGWTGAVYIGTAYDHRTTLGRTMRRRRSTLSSSSAAGVESTHSTRAWRYRQPRTSAGHRLPTGPTAHRPSTRP